MNCELTAFAIEKGIFFALTIQFPFQYPLKPQQIQLAFLVWDGGINLSVNQVIVGVDIPEGFLPRIIPLVIFRMIYLPVLLVASAAYV